MTQYSITRYHQAYDPAVKELCRAFSSESLQEYGLEVSDERLAQMTEVCKGISFFLTYKGTPVGLIAGFMVQNLTNGKPALQEVIWYVHRRHRRQGMKLLDYFEQAAAAQGAKQIVMMTMANSKAKSLGAIYERKGYRAFEIQYIKEVDYATGIKRREDHSAQGQP